MLTVLPRFAASAYSRRDSVGVSWTISPRTVADRRRSSSVSSRPEDELAAGHLVAEPAHDPRDPCPQLGVVVRLGDVVLGDLLEEVGLRVGRVDRREDDDREVRPGLDLAGEGQPVHAGHHHVDDQQIGPAAVEAAQRLLAVTRGLDLEAVAAQLVGQQDEQVRIVVDDQDPRRRRRRLASRPLSMAGG